MTPSRVGIDIDNRRRNWREQKRKQRARGGSGMRCLADVNTKSGDGFYRKDPDPRCTRQAVRHGYCTQHHKQLWKDHDRILARILVIPPRD